MVSHVHGRSRSRASFSIFSLDTIRSLSRAGSRQASRIPSKDELRAGAESSLSHRCDPNNQPPPTPEPSSVNVASDNSIKSNPPERVKIQEDSNTAQSQPQRFSSIRRRAHRLRPKSWLPFTRSTHTASYPRSISTQLPKTASTSTVARSVISAPILTSTTNVSVARAEGVHCGEISDVAFSQSTWNSQVGWVPKDNQDSKEAPQMLPHGGTGFSPVAENQTSWTPLKRGRIHRLRSIIRSKVRTGHPQSQTALSQREQTERANGGIDQIDGPSLKREMSYRRAETMNLYKGKLKGLTGNGHIRRKSINTTKSTADSKLEGDADPPLLGDVVDVPTTDFAAERSDADSPFGSLTKSFTSAVDKLDFHSTVPLNISFLRSKSSFFNPKKGNQDGVMSKEAGQQFSLTPPPRPAPAPPLYPIFPPSPTSSVTPTPGGDPRSLPIVPQRGVLQASKAQDPRSNQSKQKDCNSRQAVPTPMVFSNEKNGYVASTPVSGYPRGVNPLRMHPPDTMAVPPSVPNRSASIMPADKGTPQTGSRSQATAPVVEIDTDSDSVSLEDAPIYSPSLGDLSQYARETPRSENPALPETSNTQVAIPTPTHRPIKNRAQAKGPRGFLKKSKSGVSLFSRSKADRDQTVTDGALSQRDTNQKISSSAGNAVKKSRSLHFGGLFEKGEHSDLQPTTTASSPFQPATPSPLRKVMRYGSQSTGGNSPTTLPAIK